MQVDIVPRYFELIGPKHRREQRRGHARALPAAARLSGLSARMLKRTMDIAVSALATRPAQPGLPPGAPSRSSSTVAGPVFFRQPRIGESGREFSIVKFRTMVRDAEQRKKTVAHLNKHADRRSAHVQGPERPARHARRADPAPRPRSTSCRSS